MKFNIGDRVFVKHFNKFGVVTRISTGQYSEPIYAVQFDYYPHQTYNIHENVLLDAQRVEYENDFTKLLED